MRNQTQNQKQIKFSDVKQALLDARFRDTLPEDLMPDIQKFLKNPGCACNADIYRKVLQQCSAQLKRYFPAKEYVDPVEEDRKIAQNYWSVISCHVNELEAKLKTLPPGRKQLAVARWEDQVTVVVNELDVLF